MLATGLELLYVFRVLKCKLGTEPHCFVCTTYRLIVTRNTFFFFFLRDWQLKFYKHMPTAAPENWPVI